MTQEEILEGNILIAEFMGLQTGKHLGYNRWQDDWFDNLDVINGQRNEKLLFDSDWNWLIPVVEKITSDDLYLKYKNETSNIVSEGGIYINTKFIINTFEDVVDFIKWYNKNKEINE